MEKFDTFWKFSTNLAKCDLIRTILKQFWQKNFQKGGEKRLPKSFRKLKVFCLQYSLCNIGRIWFKNESCLCFQLVTLVLLKIKYGCFKNRIMLWNVIFSFWLTLEWLTRTGFLCCLSNLYILQPGDWNSLYLIKKNYWPSGFGTINA